MNFIHFICQFHQFYGINAESFSSCSNPSFHAKDAGIFDCLERLPHSDHNGQRALSVAVLQPIWLYEIIGGTLPMYQNPTLLVNGAWIKRHCVLCSKTHNTSHSCHNFPAGSPQAAGGARICETSLFARVHSLPSLYYYHVTTSSCIADRYRLTTFSVTACPHHNCNTGSWIYRVGKYVTQTHHEVFAQANINKAKEKREHILRHVLYMF